ncbi:hypothetical protein LUZ60_006163 [Juncus effusus]|nr:hypothetical protein LUZ60_006163 [Juncus effusus]
MLARIIFYVSVSAAILAVILLATISPLPKSSHKATSSDYNWIILSLYIQPNSSPIRQDQQATHHLSYTDRAYVFRHRLTIGPNNTSRVVGSVHGFVLPVQGTSLFSSFNMVHLALFYSSELSGSLSIEARQGRRGEELVIVGGTGSFTFALGDAVLLRATNAQASNPGLFYLIKLRIGMSDRDPRTIPG